MLHEFFFRRFLRYSIREAVIVYRLIDAALIRIFLLSLLILKSEFWPNVVPRPRYATKGWNLNFCRWCLIDTIVKQKGIANIVYWLENMFLDVEILQHSIIIAFMFHACMWRFRKHFSQLNYTYWQSTLAAIVIYKKLKV